MGAWTSANFDSTLGLKMDAKEMSQGSTVPNGQEDAEKACKFEQESESEKGLPQDADGDVGLEDQKPAKGTGILLIPLPKVPSQSGVLLTEQNKAHREHDDEGDSFLSSTPTTLHSDVDIVDIKTEMSHGVSVSLDTDLFAEDTCIPPEECTSPLQPAEILDILETDASAIKLELPFNRKIGQRDEEGYTQLYKAALEGHLEGVDDLISRGANPNKPSKGGLRPFHAAAQKGHTHIVEFLILQGADVKVECDLGRTPLHIAASSGYNYIVDSLIANGANMNKKDSNGWTPFHAAVQYGHLDVIKYLVFEGVKQTSYCGISPLRAASHFGHLDVVKYFISKGADIKEVHDKGMTLLHGAAGMGHLKVMQYLIQQGSDVNKANSRGWTPFYAAVQFGHLEAVKYIMTKGAKQAMYDGMTPLYAAAYFGHLHIVKFFISKGADVNEVDDKGRIPLHGAAIRCRLKVMEYLIHQGSDVNKADAEGCTPFNSAVRYGLLEVVKYLVYKGAKQNMCLGRTLLYDAARFGHLDIVTFLISKGADVNEENESGKIPLHGAAARGHMKVMKYLIQQGSDVNKADVKGWTPFNAAVQYGKLESVKYLLTKSVKENRYCGIPPLHGASRSGHFDVVNLFISRGADVNEEDDKGKIPLHSAAARGHMTIIKYLIQHGSDVNKSDAKGRTPFNAAVKYGHIEAVKYLITKDADQNRYAGVTPLHVAARFGLLDIVKFFISKGDDVNEEDVERMIPLHGAAVGGHVKVMEYLIQQGSDVNKKDYRGWTPLHGAVRNGHLEVVKLLMAKGAQATRFDGLTPLYIATQYGHIDVVKFLVSDKYDVNERSEYGKSPLHAACYIGNIDIVKYLLLQNANVNEQDHDGWTPIHAAAQEGHQDIVDYFVLNGADMNVRDIDGLTPLQAAENAGHSIVLEYVSLSESDAYNEDQRCLQGVARNLTTRDYVVLDMKDADTQSCEGKSTSQNGNVDNRNDCTQADNAKRGPDEPTLNNLFTRTHDDDKDAAHPDVNEHVSPRRGDPNEEDTGDPLSGGHYYGAKHLATRGYAKEKVIQMKEVDTQSLSGQLASHVDNVEGGYDCPQADITKRGAGELSLENLSTRTHDIDQHATHPEVNEHVSPCRGGGNEEETGDPLSGGHHYGAKKKKKVVKMKKAYTQSPIRQSAYHVNNIQDGYDCTQADNAKRRADEVSLKSLPTMTNDDEKGGNEEHNPFIHAKLKYPAKGEHDLMPDHMEAIQNPVPRNRDTITNSTDCSSPRGPQTGQYSGCDPPFLQTMETDGHPAEEPESSCHSLTDKNRQMREFSTPMDARNNIQINGTSTGLESFPTHPPEVVHQKLYDGNPVSTQGTSSHPVWKIETERRTVLALEQTFLQMIIASAIILAGSPVLVAGSGNTERITLQAGKPGMVPFHLPLPPIGTPQTVPYYTLRFESQPRPFCINGQADTMGFKNSSQLRRFTTSVTGLDTSPCVNLIIDTVDILDEGVYVLTAVWHSFENIRYESLMKEIVVQIPPGRAKCFITLSEKDDYPCVHCRATTGSVATTLSCYQDDQRLDVTGDITDNGQVTRGIFWLVDYTHFSCCSHDVTSYVNVTMCNDFVWPPDIYDKETTSQIVNTVPTSITNNNSGPVNEHHETTLTIQIESHTESGACRQFMPPSLWYPTYMFVYILAFDTM